MFLAESSIQLVPDGTLLLHVLIIAIMVAVLNRTLLKPINEILHRRDALMSGRMTEAQVLDATRAEKLNEYEAALSAARTEGYQMLEAEKTAALREREARLNAAKQEITEEVASAIESTHRQQAAAQQDLEARAGELSGLIGEQILRRPVR
ncbi:MAG TPA: ATP synthase F0 subunit B [Pyrinomonadaceae bacterium]|nr:ATP synthase F0 subunit B [Pyrinomonadaceae bacterium]